MGIKLQGGNSSTNLVDVNSRNELQVTMPLAGVCAGFVQLSAEKDTGEAIGYRTALAAEISDDYRLRASVDQTVFNATFEGTIINTTQFSSTGSTTTNAQANGFLVVNSTTYATMVSQGAGGYVRSWRTFPTFGTYPTYVDMWIREGARTSNTVSEWGLLYLTATTTTQPLDGIFFRRISGGQLRAIVTNNSVDIVEITIDTTNVPPLDGGNHAFYPNEIAHYCIMIHNDIVRFWINDTLVGEIPCPAAQVQHASSSSLPVGFRVLNFATGVPSAARQIHIGYVNVGIGDQNINKPWSNALVGAGQGSYQRQTGSTVAPTVTRTAATNGHPASATTRTAGTWVATVSPSTNDLGGLWTSPTVTSLTADADYPIFAFLNVAGTATVPGKTLYITGVRIGESRVNAIPTDGVFFSYIVTVDGSSSTTSTTDSATSVSGKSIVIGGQGFGPSDVSGSMKPGFDMTFTSPLIVPPGRYVSLIVRPYGNMAAINGTISGSIAFNGYFE